MHVRRSQVYLGTHAWPTQPHVQPKARKDLAAGMVFTKAGDVIKVMATGGASKLADQYTGPKNLALTHFDTVGEPLSSSNQS